MQTIQKIKHLLWTSAGCLLTMCVTILLMPLANNKAAQTDNISLMVVGGIFWVSLLVGYALLIRANILRKCFIRRQIDSNASMKCRIGIITFFSNIPATIADAVMLTSILVISVIMFTSLKDNFIVYVLLFLLSFSFNMHCVLNGRIYKFIKFKCIRREENHDKQ